MADNLLNSIYGALTRSPFSSQGSFSAFAKSRAPAAKRRFPFTVETAGSKSKGYRPKVLAAYSHYNLPIDRADGLPHGRSRLWGGGRLCSGDGVGVTRRQWFWRADFIDHRLPHEHENDAAGDDEN